mmetsp:Transcript_14017/g.20063  ORF Transcript_14017/g.20063 Transcript_14017/m.20063 type:complete len:96 (-) Transcript_14017:1112-1399(-)
MAIFSPVWSKAKIFKQTELECGARVCLHGLCFAVSHRNSSEIMYNINRINDLAARSRQMVSKICQDGYWSSQGWLKSIIGTPDSVILTHATDAII